MELKKAEIEDGYTLDLLASRQVNEITTLVKLVLALPAISVEIFGTSLPAIAFRKCGS